ncbi:alpha/beta fold hydrolase [Streptomyces sp. 6N223]|uniref:alpha/beta fold hydrolase n=1 Tax=Streptomyces sp. 6N223 TaxID=3457412 RepID=UPI003FD0DB2A
MNSVEELKQYVGVHAKGLEITDYQRLLDRIATDGDGPGSWTGEWTAEGDRLHDSGQHLQASRHYLMARFPFVDGAARQEAYEKSLSAFELWRTGQDIHRMDIDVAGRQVGCWQTGLSATRRRPVLVIMGGHLTLKEQWAPALPVFARLGFATIVTELPGVGENEVPYDAGSWRFLSAILDAVADRADVARSYTLAMSFSGHQALRCAMEDPRIRGVVTAGAPIAEFFTDSAWQKDLPRVTVETLTHLTGLDVAELGDWALPPERLAALDIPVAYLASLRDEVIPPADLRLLRQRVRDLRLLEHDDVHGSPGHTEENKLWLALSLLRIRGDRDPRTFMIGLMYRMARARARLRRRPA